MAAAHRWDPDQDATILRMRADGKSWDDIAAVLGLSRYPVIERGRRLGARVTPQQQDTTPDVRDGVEALPAGHPRTWGAITRGTCLEGMPWPGDGE